LYFALPGRGRKKITAGTVLPAGLFGVFQSDYIQSEPNAKTPEISSVFEPQYFPVANVPAHPAFYRADKIFHLFSLALGNNLNRTVGEVAGESRYIIIARDVFGRKPETHTLNHPGENTTRSDRLSAFVSHKEYPII
jgi:hypothetical protein